MCSFLILNKKIADLDYVNEKNKRRGPDDTSKVFRDGFLFVHNLLSITGNFTKQPFICDDIVCLYNGEIYNFKEFDKNASSDGEIIIPAYRDMGLKFAKYLDGEYSIVIFDFSKKDIILITDSFATKPLWIGREKGDFGISSYESCLSRAGISSSTKIDCNSIIVLDMDTFHVKKTFKIKNFDIENQFKDSFHDWDVAFSKSIEKRTRDLRERVFIGLSGGYDSGAIACELNKQNINFKSYSIKAQENEQVILSRHEILKNHGQETEMIYLTRDQFNASKDELKQRAEEFTYQIKRNKIITKNEFMTDDKGAVGLYHICKKASKESIKIYISGQGADEILSDYGFGGKSIYGHSTISGHFPNDLRNCFPWNNFYNGTQKSYLGKEENVAGACGIESRYPFLDFQLVQEFLWLKSELKNRNYKSPIYNFLRNNNFPFDPNVKIGFSCDKNLRD
jgi:asparagine synthase (glutamine-hydrolysing)